MSDYSGDHSGDYMRGEANERLDTQSRCSEGN